MTGDGAGEEGCAWGACCPPWATSVVVDSKRITVRARVEEEGLTQADRSPFVGLIAVVFR
jgi:hypothetical protein